MSLLQLHRACLWPVPLQFRQGLLIEPEVKKAYIKPEMPIWLTWKFSKNDGAKFCELWGLKYSYQMIC